MNHSMLAATLVLLATAALTRSIPAPNPQAAAPAQLADLTKLQAGVFLDFTQPTFTIKDNEPVDVGMKLKEDPKTVKPRVFVQADGLRFDKCALDYDTTTWSKPQSVKVYPKASFTAGKAESVLSTMLAWQGNANHGKIQSLKFTRDVAAGRTCQAVGDPHYTTFDKKHFDFMGMKCYYTFKSPTLVVQSRHGPWSQNKAAAVHIGVAVIYGKTAYVVDIINPDKTKLLQMLSPNSDGVTVVRKPDNSNILFQMSDGSQVSVDLAFPGTPGGFGNVNIVVPACYKGKTQGLCGVYDDKPDNDFTGPDGKVVADSNAFANAWAIPEAEDVFVKGYQATIATQLQVQPTTQECAFPKDLSGFGVAPQPEGYAVAAVAQTTKYEATPVPVVAATTVSNERKDPEFEKFARDVCTRALTVPGLDKVANKPDLKKFIDDCVTDCKLGGSLSTVDSFRVSYQTAAFALSSSAFDKFKICEKTGKPRPRKPEELAQMEAQLGMSAFKCPAVGGDEYAVGQQCGGKGSCQNFGCKCNPGFSKFDCSMDLKAEEAKMPPAPKPAPAPAPVDEYAVAPPPVDEYAVRRR